MSPFTAVLVLSLCGLSLAQENERRFHCDGVARNTPRGLPVASPELLSSFRSNVRRDGQEFRDHRR